MATWWANLELGLKFSLVLAGLIVLTVFAALIKVAVVKSREKKILADLEAARCEAKEDEHNLVKRELDEGDLFGVRALEAGFTGGVHQPCSRSTTPTLKPGLGNMKAASRSTSGTPSTSRRGSLDVPSPLGRHGNGSATSLKLPARPVPALSPPGSRPGSRSASPAPLRIDSSMIPAPFKGLEWNGSRPTTPRGSHTPVPILTFSSINNGSVTDLSAYNNSSFLGGPRSPISRPESEISDGSDSLSPRIAKFQGFQHHRVDSSASSNFGTPHSSRSRSPNTSIDSTPRNGYQQRDSENALKAVSYSKQQDRGRPVLGNVRNDSGIELTSR